MAKQKVATSDKALIEINVDELKQFVTHIVHNNRFLQAGGKVPVCVNVEGDAGLGKTSAITQLSKELGLNCIRLNLAEIEELGDLVGYPIRQFQLCKSSPDKTEKKQVLEGGVMVMRDIVITKGNYECLWIDEHAIDEYVKRGYSFTGEKRMSYCPPEWITGLTGGGILILDDYSRADLRFIQACMTLIETQKYISWSLPPDWHIILTTNPDNGSYMVTAMDDAQKTRFITVNLKFDIDVWARWAETAGIDGRCINFLLLNPELVTDEVNARSITTFFNCISSIPDFENNLPMIQMIGEGSVGPEFATMFTLFINNKLDKMISPKDILFHESDIHVLNSLKNSTGIGDAYRADIGCTLATRVINYALHVAETNSIEQKTIDRIIKITVDNDIFMNDLKYVIIKKILNGNKQKFQKLMVNQEILKIAVQ